MVKKTMAVLASVMMMLAMLTACGDAADSSVASTPKAEPAASSAEEQPEEAKQESAEEGDLGDYHVKILDCETGLKDYEGNPVIGVKYEFTNNSEDTTSFDIALYPQAFQDGIELERAIMDSTSDEYNNGTKDIKNGVTLTCEVYYIMTSDKSDVEIEVTELISFSDEKLTKTFEIAK